MTLTTTKIGLAGDGWGTIAALHSLQRHFNAVEVLTSDTDVKKLLRAEDSLINSLCGITSSLFICAGYKPIIPEPELRKRPFINVHYSPLPKYRGMHPVAWAIINGEKEHGLTIHLMNRYIDDGPILAQFLLDIREKNSFQVMTECNAIVEEKLGAIITSYLDGAIQPQPQDKSLATWVPKRNLDDCVIDFNTTCVALKNFFRALVRPYPLPMIKIKGERYEVTEADILEKSYYCTPGRVVNIDNEGAWVKITDGLLLIKSLEKANETISPSAILKIGQRLQ